MGSNDTALMNMVNEKTRLAGSNRMELLLFSLGGEETFGINVFKVREVCECVPVTQTPNMPRGICGIISLRGQILPVIDLALCLDMPGATGQEGKLVVTEFSGHSQAFLVGDVDRIVRVDWDQVRAPQATLSGLSGKITALTELAGGRLVSILDVEQILAGVIGEEALPPLENVSAVKSAAVFFADDSAFARKRITQVLDRLGLSHQHATNGREAWERLLSLATGGGLEQIGLVLVDAEMPEMDGYVLTRNIKSDPRFNGLPVVMHSSLSSVANRKLGQQVGVDAYVAKFRPEELAETIVKMLRG